MKQTIRSLIVASLLVWPVAAEAGSVEDFGAAFDVCGSADSAACSQAVWSFVDKSGDGRLTKAELSRFLRVASEWAVVEQSDLKEAVGGLGLGGAEVNEDMGRAGAVALAFLSGPFTAKMVLDNFDYNNDGMLERDEVFADTDEDEFITMVKGQMEQLPQYAAMAMMAAMAAQEQTMGDDDADDDAVEDVYEENPPAADADNGASLMIPSTTTASETEVAMSEPEPVASSPSFVLRNVDSMIMTENDMDIFVISGEIINQSSETKATPDAIAQALDANNRVLKTWRLKPQRRSLGPNESAGFIGRLDDVPAGVDNWSVVLPENV